MLIVVQVLKHFLSPRRWGILFVGALVGVCVTYFANVTRRGSESGVAWWWTDWFDPWITVTTLAVALFLGARAWVDELPKRLNVHFKFEDRYVFTCWEATLADEGDVRQWAQQVGKQMAGRYLEFDLYPDISAPKTMGGSLGLRRVYEITIALTNIELSDTGYRVWGPAKTDDERLGDRPSAPMTVEQIREQRTASASLEGS